MVSWLLFFGIVIGLTIALFPDRWRGIIGRPFFIAVFFVGLFIVIPLDRAYDARLKLEKTADDTDVA